jgi:hypothetical protein
MRWRWALRATHVAARLAVRAEVTGVLVRGLVRRHRDATLHALHRAVADQRTDPSRTIDPAPLIEDHAAHETSLDLRSESRADGRGSLDRLTCRPPPLRSTLGIGPRAAGIGRVSLLDANLRWVTP